jgi:hypothetical protein
MDLPTLDCTSKKQHQLQSKPSFCLVDVKKSSKYISLLIRQSRCAKVAHPPKGGVRQIIENQQLATSSQPKQNPNCDPLPKFSALGTLGCPWVELGGMGREGVPPSAERTGRRAQELPELPKSPEMPKLKTRCPTILNDRSSYPSRSEQIIRVKALTGLSSCPSSPPAPW